MSGCETCSTSCGDSTLTGVHEWEIAFVADCNLRCDYCNTGFGRAGGSVRKMSQATQERLIEFVLEQSAGLKSTEMLFLTGETFVHFDEFIEFVDELRRRAGAVGLYTDIGVPTNGFPLNRERLEICAERRINLRFSIDGPEEVHDARRRNASGGGSFAQAFESWKAYCDITSRIPRGPSSGTASVISDASSLAIVDEFWRANGLPIYEAHIEETSRYVDSTQDDVIERHRRYLADFEAIAMREARRCGVPTFLTEFQGPSHLLRFWTQLFTEDLNPSRCGLGKSVLGVDTGGDLYPCSSFIGAEGMTVGDLWTGVDHEKLTAISHGVDALTEECNTCEAADLCGKGCAASSPDEGIVLNATGGCDFFRGVARIAKDSYDVLMGTTSAVS